MRGVGGREGERSGVPPRSMCVGGGLIQGLLGLVMTRAHASMYVRGGGEAA